MTVNAAISPSDNEDFLPFVLAGPLGGFKSTLSQTHSNRLQHEIAANKPWMRGNLGSGKTIMVRSLPLESFLQAANRTSSVIDFWSLDTEGSEPQILNATNFSKVQVGVLSVEHNNEAINKKGIAHAMEKSGLILYRELAFDYIYVNPNYFHERGLKLNFLSQ